MVTYKIRAIRQILRAKHVMLFTKSGDKVIPFGFGGATLEDLMLLAVELKRSYNNTVNLVHNATVEGSALHALEAIRKTVDTEIDNASQQ